MANKALISIAMATYNGSAFLKQQIDSILAQSYSNIELIIVDDCSTDNTIDIINDYIKKHSNITIYRNITNQGACYSFFKAISHCSGEYIALSDQDDIWHHDKIQLLINAIGDNIMIYSDAKLIDHNNHTLQESSYMARQRMPPKTVFDILWSNSIHGCTMLFRSSLLQHCKLTNLEHQLFYIHDHYLAIIASYYGTIKYYPNALTYYRQHQGNTYGAYHRNYYDFIKFCKIIADSYSLLLKDDNLKNISNAIELIRDYRLSLHLGKWSGKHKPYKILRIQSGYKYLIVYYMIHKKSKLSAWIYKLMHILPFSK